MNFLKAKKLMNLVIDFGELREGCGKELLFLILSKNPRNRSAYEMKNERASTLHNNKQLFSILGDVKDSLLNSLSL